MNYVMILYKLKSYLQITPNLILLLNLVMSSLDSREKIQLKMICVSFNGNPCTTIIPCYSPTIAIDEIDIITWAIFLYPTYSQTQRSNHRWRYECSNRQRWKSIILLTQLIKQKWGTSSRLFTWEQANML